MVDITASLEVKASSRMAMVSSLNDNSTETFWESGDEDRNKSKWLTVSLKNGGKIKSISLHIDNGRDIGNKVSNLIFKGGRNADDLVVLKQTDVESRFAGWITCFVDNNNSGNSFIKIEAKGPDNSLRLRQIKALGVNAGGQELEQKQPQACSIQQRNCETETLRVFRLITNQVFGKLLDSGGGGGGSAYPSGSGGAVGDANPGIAANVETPSSTVHDSMDQQESYFKEHIVGILFNRSKLTHLQKQVCSHIVQAINKEASRLRDEWEVTLCSSGSQAMMVNNFDLSTAASDTYCFEMLSLVLALSGSTVGRSHLASQYGLIKDLLTLLHTASGRIQRQVIALLRRILPEVPPQTFASIMGIVHLPPKDFGILARSTAAMGESTSGGAGAENEPTSSGTASSASATSELGILDVFLSCISKALTLQVKSKINREKSLSTVSLASSIHPRDPTSRWWMRGSMAKKIAEEIIHLLKDMTAGQLSSEWSDITKSAVAEAILNLTKLDEAHRDPGECLKHPVVWLALASLCVLDKDHVEGLSSGRISK